MEENKNIEAGPKAEDIRHKAESNEELVENFEAKSVADNISPSEQPQTKIPKSQTETMEVHHHDHVHEKKKWKEYLFQFFMLFLAVFCGFLAEYQLEHIIENQREEQFMRSMVEDLKKDMILLKNESDLTLIQYTNLDSLTDMIYEGILDPHHVRKMYELQRRYLYPRTLQLINRTELQLKNSGGMRLIRNRQVADSIINYWSIAQLAYETRDAINVHRGKAKDISFTLFSNKYYKHNEDFSLDFPLDPLKGEPDLMNKSSFVLTEFANRVSHMSDLLKYNYKLRRIEPQIRNAIGLIQLIKKEYELK